MKRIDEEQARRIIAGYSDGTPVRALAESESVSPQTIYNVIDRSGVTRRAERTAKAALHLVELCKTGTPAAAAATYLHVSRSTATRALKEHRTQGAVIELKKGRPRGAIACSETGDPDVDAIFKYLRRVPFPYPPHLTEDVIEEEVARLRAIVFKLDGTIIHPRNSTGVRICAPFFRNRYEAVAKGSVSAMETWLSDTGLRRAIRFQLKHGDPVLPHRILRAITMQCRTPTIFRPSVARFIYERYCPVGGRTWDPCAGYGGRLLGAFAAKVQYIGTDVDGKTIEGNRQLAKAISYNAELAVSPAEDFTPPRVDLVFTSPPYFDRERYSFGSTQSWRSHGGTFDRWVDGFLRPVIQRAYNALPIGGRLILNVASIRKRSGNAIPIVERTIASAIDAGFVHAETLQMPLAAINRKNPLEPVLIFQRP